MNVYQVLFDVGTAGVLPFVYAQLRKSRQAFALSRDTVVQNGIITTLVRYPLGLRLAELAHALGHSPADLRAVLDGLRDQRLVMASPVNDGTGGVKYHLA
jgi:hypothetical protein